MEHNATYGLTAEALVEAFPYHVVFDRHMVIRQAGHSARRLPELGVGATLPSQLRLVEPGTNWGFESILENRCTPFVLDLEQQGLSLRGPMVLVREPAPALIFLGAPWPNRGEATLETSVQTVHAARLAALGELAAGVAHELNQPLNGLKLIIQSLLRYRASLSEASAREELGVGLELIDEMAEIIDHMRILSRKGSERPPERLDLNRIVGDTLKLIAQQIRDSGIELSVDLCDTPVHILGDPVRLTQTVLALLCNARDSLSEQRVERPRILIATRREREDVSSGLGASVMVQDNGPGVPADLRGRIFEPFFTTKPPGMGAGLGSPIAAKIAQQHQGELVCASVPYRETQFTLRLPLQGAVTP